MRARRLRSKVADTEVALKEFVLNRRLPSVVSAWRRHGLIGGAARSKVGFTVAHSHIWFDASDGVRVAGSWLGEATGDTAVVVVHGFNGYRWKPKMRILAEGLARTFPVLAFDLRGHGQSAGACSGGEFEPLDVHAAVQFARRRGYERVVTVGASLGGIAVVKEAADFDDVDAVVAISTPSRWGMSDTPAVRRMTWVFTNSVGRVIIHRLFGTRIALNWGDPEPPIEAVARIAAPLLIVHGADDHFFPAGEAEALYERASEPKRLIILERFGHAEDGFTDAFARQIGDEIHALLDLRRVGSVSQGEPDPGV